MPNDAPHLPSQIASFAQSLTLDSRAAAHLRIDASGRITHAGGNLARYGLAENPTGQPLEDAAPFLVGLIPLSARSLSLRWMQVAPATTDPARPIAIADVHLMQDGDSVWVLLLDATDAAAQLQSMQQKGNELALERDRLAKRVRDLEDEVRAIKNPQP